MVVGSGLFAGLLLVAHVMDPEAEGKSDYGIAAAHAAESTIEGSFTVPIYDKLRALPIR